MSKKETSDECFACGKVRRCEVHHVLMERFAPKESVLLCVSCHDAIDRMEMSQWGVSEAWEGIAGVMAAGHEARLFMLKMLKITAHSADMMRERDQPPYGYRFTKDGRAVVDDGEQAVIKACKDAIANGMKWSEVAEELMTAGLLVPHAGEQEVIRIARELRATGMSLRDIAAAIDEAGHKARNNGAQP